VPELGTRDKVVEVMSQWLAAIDAVEIDDANTQDE